MEGLSIKSKVLIGISSILLKLWSRDCYIVEDYVSNKSVDMRNCLVIPSIDFEMNLYGVDSELNNVDYNIEVLKELVELEKWLYQRLNFDYETLESIRDILEKSMTTIEKEIYDLFGIKFIGNKELKRLYMPESWKGHPLKKDYIENDERLNWNE